eukprot:9460001-Pyramimonas_sp.AAC.1
MVYGGPRMIQIREAVSSAFSIGCSIVAGCSFATTMLRVVLHDSLVYMQKYWPSLSLYVLVGDITVSALGSEKFARESLSRALPALR